MSVTVGTWKAGELVPLADRIRYLQFFRVAAGALIVAFVLLVPDLLGAPHVPALLGSTAGYLAVSLVGELVWRAAGRRGLPLFGAMLIVDGLYLAWVVNVTGGNTGGSPLLMLVLVHLVVVALLASHRTGLKLAMWHSLLLFAVHHLQQAGLVEPVADGVRLLGSDYERLTFFVVIAWAATLSAAAFSAVNERELRRQRYDLEALTRMAATLEGADRPAAVAERLLDELVDAFGFERSVVIDAREDAFAVLAGQVSSEADRRTARLNAASVLARATTGRRTLLVSELDQRADPWLASLLPGSRNLVVVPLTAEGRAIGVVVAEHSIRRGSRIERRVVTMVERFSAHAALALRNAWLLEQLQAMARTDGLTLIANRRAFETALANEMSRAARGKTALSLVMLDIDAFKQLNDTYGHQTGDDVLRKVAAALRASCRDFDTAARFGGEEFAVLLPGCPADEAFALAERLRRAVGTIDAPVPVTASAGVATCPVHAATPEQLVRAADAALYASKRLGRDRTTAAGIEGQPSAATPSH